MAKAEIKLVLLSSSAKLFFTLSAVPIFWGGINGDKPMQPRERISHPNLLHKCSFQAIQRNCHFMTESMCSYLKEVLGSLPHVFCKHWRIESLCFILQQPTLIPGLVCCQIFKVRPSVTLEGGTDTYGTQ